MKSGKFINCRSHQADLIEYLFITKIKWFKFCYDTLRGVEGRRQDMQVIIGYREIRETL